MNSWLLDEVAKQVLHDAFTSYPAVCAVVVEDSTLTAHIYFAGSR